MNEIAVPSAAARPRSDAPSLGRQMLNKVPEITLYFWMIKILCTTVGETAADLLNENLGLGLTNTTYIMAALLIAVLVFQFRARKYVPGHLLARGRPDQRRRHAVQRQPGRQPRGRAADDDDRLQHHPGAGLRRLVRERAHALGPHHRHHPPRGLLLAGDPLHLRPRHLGRGPRRREARTRLPALGRDLRRGDRDRRRRPLPLQAERDPRLLDRLHPHPPARRLDRRLPLPAGRRNRPRPGHDPDQPDLPHRDPRPGRLPDDLQARPDRGLQPRRRSSAGSRTDGASRRPVLVVTNKTDATPAVIEAVRERAAAGPARFFVLVPNPDHLAFDRNSTDTSVGEQVLERALPLLEEPAGTEVEGRVAASPNAYDDIVEELNSGRLPGDHPRDAAQPRLALAARRPPRAGGRPRLPGEDGDGHPLSPLIWRSSSLGSCAYARLGRRGRGEDGGADSPRPERAGPHRRRRRDRGGRGRHGSGFAPTTRSSST